MSDARIPVLLPLITLRFNCGKRKIWSTIHQKSNIMNMAVVKFFL